VRTKHTTAVGPHPLAWGGIILLTSVFKVDSDKLAKLKELLLRSSAEPLLPTNPYESFRTKIGTGLVVGYTSGKIVANSPSAAEAVGDAIRQLLLGPKDYDILIGSDEAGKGEWLGPMTVAAVAFTPSQAVEAATKGIMDSKELSVPRILDLADHIRRSSSGYHVVVIGPRRFDGLLRDARDEGKNLNDILAWAHARAVDQVYRSLPEELARIKVVIDEFDRLKTEERLRRVLSLERIVLEQRPGAEEEMAVAAAGILARAEWERWVDQESSRLGLDLRSMTPKDAMSRGDIETFAKASYLGRRRNEGPTSPSV